MTQDEIIRMVYEAGGVKGEHTVLNHTWFELTAEDIERFAALVAAHEREACAIAGGAAAMAGLDFTEVAAAIRARGDK